jgi:hypothetical protein
MSKKTEYEMKLQNQLDEFSAEIDRLKTRADKAETEAEPWHHKQIEALREKHRLAKE